MADSESSQKLKIVVKTPKDKKEVEVTNNGGVNEVMKIYFAKQ